MRDKLIQGQATNAPLTSGEEHTFVSVDDLTPILSFHFGIGTVKDFRKTSLSLKTEASADDLIPILADISKSTLYKVSKEYKVLDYGVALEIPKIGEHDRFALVIGLSISHDGLNRPFIRKFTVPYVDVSLVPEKYKNDGTDSGVFHDLVMFLKDNYEATDISDSSITSSSITVDYAYHSIQSL